VFAGMSWGLAGRRCSMLLLKGWEALGVAMVSSCHSWSPMVHVLETWSPSGGNKRQGVEPSERCWVSLGTLFWEKIGVALMGYERVSCHKRANLTPDSL
jgi:hypothetical protein